MNGRKWLGEPYEGDFHDSTVEFCDCAFEPFCQVEDEEDEEDARRPIGMHCTFRKQILETVVPNYHQVTKDWKKIEAQVM